jgi:hypothetical protein
LYIVIEAKNLTGNSDVLMRFNSDSGSNYSATILTGDGSSASSARRTSSTSVILNYFDFLNSTTATQFNVNIQNYSNATTNKTALVRANRANQATEAVVGLWRNTAAITQIDLTPSSSSFAVGSTFSLYGIAASSVGAKATGGAIYSDSQYYYHAFTASGTFTPTQSITADCLVVAGGGGAVHGGGGAGGLLAFTGQSLTATGYTVTVGAGGAGGNTTNTKGANGSDSQFGALTLVKGGGGGALGIASPSTLRDGSTGGSGGGGAPVGVTVGIGGSATSGQGFAGGNSGTGAITYPGGGGGGAGAAGAVGVNATGGGAGGIGSSTYSSWGVATGIGQNVSGTYYLAGGGGGGSDSGAGAGGLGGGGAGAALTATAGTANTGGGAGGSSNNPGVAGGSGVVIVRYAK